MIVLFSCTYQPWLEGVQSCAAAAGLSTKKDALTVEVTGNPEILSVFDKSERAKLRPEQMMFRGGGYGIETYDNVLDYFQCNNTH